MLIDFFWLNSGVKWIERLHFRWLIYKSLMKVHVSNKERKYYLSCPTYYYKHFIIEAYLLIINQKSFVYVFVTSTITLYYFTLLGNENNGISSIMIESGRSFRLRCISETNITKQNKNYSEQGAEENFLWSSNSVSFVSLKVWCFLRYGLFIINAQMLI